MRKVLYLITELDVGGAEKALFELATRLDRKQFVPVVVSLTTMGPIAGWLQQAGVEVIAINMRGWWDLRAWMRLRRELRKREPHVLHTFLFHANIAGRLAAIGLGIPKVISSIRVEEPRRLHLWLERLTHCLAERITCVSESAKAFMHKRARIPLDKLAVIHNGIALDRWNPPFPSPPAEWNLPPDAPIVAVVGRLTAQKDPLLMLQAGAQVIRSVPNAVFAFAGTGELEHECRRVSEDLGIASQVRWLGWVPDTRPLFGCAHVVALSSLWEGLPNALLEAMACARPVVATDVGGCPELIGDTATGFLVRKGDAGQLAARMVELLQDASLRQRMGEAGRSRAEREFSISAMVAGNVRLYG